MNPPMRRTLCRTVLVLGALAASAPIRAVGSETTAPAPRALFFDLPQPSDASRSKSDDIFRRATPSKRAARLLTETFFAGVLSTTTYLAVRQIAPQSFGNVEGSGAILGI